MSDSLKSKEESKKVENPDLDKLIESLESIQQFDPSMPLAIEESISTNDGFYLKYLSFAWYIDREDEKFLDFVVMDSSVPYTTVGCLQKSLSSFKGKSYKIRCMKYTGRGRDDLYEVKELLTRQGLYFCLVI